MFSTNNTILFLLPVILVLCFFMSLFIARRIRLVAHKIGMIDAPNSRSSHTQPTPRGGGLAFLITFMVASMLMFTFRIINFLEFIPLFVCAPIVSITGWLDDKSSLSARTRLIIQIVCSLFSMALITQFFNKDIHASFIPITSQFILILLSVLFFVWSINLYNFMDGIDGLASSQAIFLGLSLAFFNFFESEYDFMILHLILASSVAGFLVLNWSPAKVFMGDVGSYFLGFYFACMGVLMDIEGKIQLPTLGILMAPLIVDATYTLLIRLSRGQKIYRPHKDHAFQHLIQKGLSHKRVTTYYLLVSFLWCLPLAILSELNNSPIRIFIWVVSYVPLIFMCFYLKAGKPINN